MARITLDHIRHAYGIRPSAPKDYALREVHHEWEDGGAYALLGPSGCGKTTLLNIISGLVTPSEGRILFDGRDVTRASTEARNIAQVFQFPVVYDTMTVYDNLAFPLRNRGVGEAEVKRRVEAILEMTGLADRAHRKAQGLTADQKQKISLGRGLVRPDVSAILFDEPLTVIDPHMKWQLRSQLKRLHRQFGYTMVYVTHDQTEALTFAHKVVVMYDGEIVQIGTPAELFEKPKHTFVGYFIGSPGMNVLPMRLEGSEAVIGEGAAIRLEGIDAQRAGKAGKLEFGIRPEFVRIGREGYPLQVTKVEDLGRQKIVRGAFAGQPITAIVAEDGEVPADARLTFDPAGINIYADSWLIEQQA
ncbi:carbohydrate ABC transporter ATP-binding protein, CUT1 family [Rhizobium sp. RU20A]|uniref:ABC transporter ATP-binding protein n=2 Tax=unclassified Rhizobium TaxID=2613769 RepID=UPI000956DA7D|nr:ABC transporter ATP-binding protein [Rhizobium sp. RU20A]SIR49812.1 carbohydrate ABC transporter ATP-binding protein, CUT1 family [Rhizobium sp. RU20A]